MSRGDNKNHNRYTVRNLISRLSELNDIRRWEGFDYDEDYEYLDELLDDESSDGIFGFSPSKAISAPENKLQSPLVAQQYEIIKPTLPSYLTPPMSNNLAAPPRTLHFHFQKKIVQFACKTYHRGEIRSVQRFGKEIQIQTSTNAVVSKKKFRSVFHAKYVERKLSTFIGAKIRPKDEHLSSDDAEYSAISRCSENASNRLCQHVVELLHSLFHCSSLDLQDTQQKTTFIKYCQVNCIDVLNNWMHFLSYHKQNLNVMHAINNYFSEQVGNCDVLKCMKSQRHRQNREKVYYNEDDAHFYFYRDLFDNIHCYLYHLWDYGYRTGQNRKSLKINMEYPRQRFHIQNHEDDMEYTFMDHLRQYCKAWELQHLMDRLIDEEYDTDAIRYDIHNGSSFLNIWEFIGDHRKYQQFKQHIEELQGTPPSCAFFVYDTEYVDVHSEQTVI